MNNMKKNTSYTEILRQENEITKLKIQAEFGIELSDNEELNPAIESIWLNQILEYERSMINNKKITIGEMLDQSFCKPAEEISDDEVSIELHNIMELMRLKNMVVESIYGIDDREMYRFITQELFLKETDSCFPKNMIVCYVYEEFYPNDECDLKNKADEFVHALIDKEDNFIERFFALFDDEEHGHLFKSIDKDKHIPNQVAMLMYKHIHQLHREGRITGEHLIYLNAELQSFADICGGCERIKNTPIPYSYSVFIKKFIFIYVMTLPYGYVFSLGYYVIPVVAFIFYVLASLELIAEEIEDPFGHDENDVPTQKIAENIQKNVWEIL